MKLAYYLLTLDKKIDKCSNCPICTYVNFGCFCNQLKRGVVSFEIDKECPLVYIEGKIDQN